MARRSGLWTWIRFTIDWGRKWLVDFSAGKTLMALTSLIMQVLLMWKWFFLRKNHVLRCWGWQLGSYIISVVRTASKKIRAMIRYMKFFSPEVALYIHKSTICPWMEYCRHACAGAPSCYLELLDKLQKQICRTVGPSLAPSLGPLAH